MNNIVQAILDRTYPEANKKVWQYDYGQILRIQGGKLPKAVEIHFSFEQSRGNSITRIGTTQDGITEVPIPDSLLEADKTQDYSIYAFAYIEDGTSGNTEYRIRIPVRTRPKPEIHETPEETELFRETIKAVNDAADRADVSERNAKISETEAGRYAEEAKKNAQETAQTKEVALKEIGEKKQDAISAIKKQEESSIGNVTEHADTEIQRIQNQTSESKRELETSIEQATNKNAKLEESIQTARERKSELDKSIESAGEQKSELINSVNAAERTKSGLDESIQTASDKKAALDTTIGQANTVDASLKKQIGGAEKIQENVEQIAINKTDISLLKEDKADKTSLAQTDRKLDALWKLNQGISYEFQTDDTEAYQKTVPSGAKLASVKEIGGKTIVWNQLITNARKISFSVKEEQNEGWLKTTNTMCHSEALLIKNHTYIGLLQTDCKNITVMNTAYGEVAMGIFTCKNAQRYNKDYDLYVVSSGVNVGEYYFSYMLFDLTQMFGSGNEPSTTEEFEAMFPADYYPYNAGELMSAPVNEVTYSDTKNQETSYPIPQAILNLPDYGWSVGDVRNEVAYENKQYIQRVGKTEFNGDEQWYSWGETIDGSQALLVYVDSAKVPTNNNNILTSKYTVMEYIKVFNGDKGIGLGVYENRPVLLIRDSNYTNVTVWKNHLKEENLTVYYELAEPIVTDISDIIDNTFQEPLEVEAGGSLTFKNSNGDNYRISVPSSEEYVISLAEVAK